MISDYNKSQQNIVFNPADFIDGSTISKSQADSLYLNQVSPLETMLGSLTITGTETVQNQVVLGNNIVNGDEIVSGTLRAGVANNTSKDSFIYGNVTIGDQNSASNTTRTYMLGENVIGITKPTTINGFDGVTINTNASYGGNTTIGRTLKTVNLKGTLNIGESSGITTMLGTTNVNGTVNIGDTSGNGIFNVRVPINSTSTINAGKALNQNSSSTIAGNVILGDTGWGTQVPSVGKRPFRGPRDKYSNVSFDTL